MKKLMIVIIALVVLQGIANSNKYRVLSSNDGTVYIDRKGRALKFWDPTKTTKTGDSIRLFFDYDINYRHH